MKCDNCKKEIDGDVWAVITKKGYYNSCNKCSDIILKLAEKGEFEILEEDLKEKNKKEFAELSKIDPVNHPSHYTSKGVECITVTEQFNFCRGNAIKYIWRAGEKDKEKEIEDLKKAIWYIEREIERLKR